MTTGHVLLGLLSRGQQHGYDLKREHDALFPAAKELAFGQVYAALGRLQDKGFVEEAARERVDGPDRTAYRLTDAGRDELASWLATVEPLPEPLRPPGNVHRREVGQIRQQRRVHAAQACSRCATASRARR